MDSVEDSLTSLFVWQQPEVSLVLLPFGPIWCSPAFVAKGWNYWHNCLISRYIVGCKSNQGKFTSSRLILKTVYLSTVVIIILCLWRHFQLNGLLTFNECWSNEKHMLLLLFSLQWIFCHFNESTFQIDVSKIFF